MIVDVDEARRRLAYSVRSERIAHHNASFQVIPEGEGSRLVWIADVLPAEAAVTVGAMMEDGIGAAKRALDGAGWTRRLNLSVHGHSRASPVPRMTTCAQRCPRRGLAPASREPAGERLQPQRAGHRRVHDLAGHDVEALGEARIVGQRPVDAVGGQGGDVGRGGGAQGVGRGQRRGARHVGDAVVDDAVDDEGGIGVGGGVAGLEAAALVDGDVHQHRARAHPLEVGAGHQLGRRGAGDQHAADHQVGRRQQPRRRRRGWRRQVFSRPPNWSSSCLEAGGRDVEQGDVGAVADRHLGRVLAG